MLCVGGSVAAGSVVLLRSAACDEIFACMKRFCRAIA